MLNFNPETADDPRRNFRAIERHVDDGLYVWRLAPADFCADPNFPGAVFGSTANSKCAAIRFADAATQGVLFNRRIPRMWVTGHLLLEIDYTSTTAGTANFNVDVVINASTKSGNLNVPTILYSLTTTWPGPTNAFDQVQFFAYTTTPMPAGTNNISLILRRNGAADANNNRLDVTAATLTFIPSLREAHVP